ncbi:hypothetical protein PHJA_002793200 [Phtheirospermum japonicum]|uniref:Stalled ribosome sensor GCN1-like N-terminal domain-containing protein n=1 Tax=Phtheirospermum japonicum TaxID=374723 RepID=A0A830DKP5_9LAMI|nr:hypothetical protein PHJA_002793200 [Phtheirospermum japonicum]
MAFPGETHRGPPQSFSSFNYPFVNTILSLRNPDFVLESIRVVLISVTVNLDLSTYAIEILSVVLAEARHAGEGRRLAALVLVRCLSQKSKGPDAIESMFTAIRSVMEGSEVRLTHTYQRVGMINALREVSDPPEGKYFTSLSPTVCGFLLSCYNDGSLGCKIDATSSDLLTFFVSGLKEKEKLRMGHLRCPRLVCNNTDVVVRMSSLLLPLLKLVGFGVAVSAQRLDVVFALFCVMKIAANDVNADEILSKKKIWQLTLLILQSEPPSIIPDSLTSGLLVEFLKVCVGLVEVLLDYPKRSLEKASTIAFLKVIRYVVTVFVL